MRARQLQLKPLCEACEKRGLIRSARVADHIEPHRDNEAKFWNGALQSLCTPCHSGDKQAFEKTGRMPTRIGPDGWPIE
ncbi:HNH endonuclease [Rhizobacter sp. Root404]|uniref:HNH endonuclease n=1 Tax=Rhizobacter sp. Root404 TaxID=1736528 RepID=UPI0006FD604D|nr:HNH endonuclease [Rhizobacter sp. Root404]KQW36514.1 hypothetical protein ASC76_17770 [Rhizobacter sp. Root404]